MHSSQLSVEFDKVLYQIKAEEQKAIDEENQAFADDKLDASPKEAADENANINLLVRLEEAKVADGDRKKEDGGNEQVLQEEDRKKME